jgi:hypothetical protein
MMAKRKRPCVPCRERLRDSKGSRAEGSSLESMERTWSALPQPRRGRGIEWIGGQHMVRGGWAPGSG